MGKLPLHLMEQLVFITILLWLHCIFYERILVVVVWITVQTESSRICCCLNAGITWIPKWSLRNANHNVSQSFTPDCYFLLFYRVSIKSFPDYKHLLQENYMEYKYIFFPLYKLISKISRHVFIVMLQLHNLLVSKWRQWKRKPSVFCGIT